MTARNDKPRIGIMIGDPAGIGPEVSVKALASENVRTHCVPLLIGSAAAVTMALRCSSISMPIHEVASPEEADGVDGLAVLDPGDLKASDISFGNASAVCGRAVFGWIGRAEALARSGGLDGWIMAPVNGDSLKMAGVVKHLDELQPPGTYMLRLNGPMRVVPITEHIPIREVPASVTTKKVLELIKIADAHLRRWGLPRPRIAVAGLNPHAMFEEDHNEIKPAIAQAVSAGIDATGPVPPDSVFRMAAEGKFDVVVTMYHDQGQIAIKTTAFAGACTVYINLPYVQLSVPHGTAFDIAGRGVAQHLSMAAAIRTAAMLAAGKGFVSA